MNPEDVLTFWIGTPDGDPFANEGAWWRKDDAFDAEIRERFGAALEDAAAGTLKVWESEPRSTVALVILMDQFSRNIHRGSPQAFSLDGDALAVARRCIARGADARLRPVERTFLYMPFMHAEDLRAQDEALVRFAILVEEAPEEQRARIVNNLVFGVKHRRIIERFGRFPHRNAVLGRTSTAEELAFLREPGSSF